MLVEWERFGHAWFQSVTDAIVSTAAANPAERFYAGAFWLLHGTRRSILVPAFGLGAESSPPDTRWHPPDWRWSVIDAAHEALQPLYHPLLALELEDESYGALWEAHIDMLASVSRRVTELVRANEIPVDGAAFSRGFFVGIIDFAQGAAAADYLKRSVDAETIAASGILGAAP